MNKIRDMFVLRKQEREGGQNMDRNEKYPGLGIITTEGSKAFATRVNEILDAWDETGNNNYLIPSSCPRFGSGEAKGLIKESIRGKDIYIFVDVCNYSLTYKLCGMENHMSPDDHFQDLKRLIAACNGKARRITVIMPFLYEGRQHRRTTRESLDCALMLHELANMGVSDIITFDAHDPRVQNSIPLNSLENVRPVYQVMSSLLNEVKDLIIDDDNLMIVSPDEGASERAIYLANILGVNIGMFYKRRDYTQIIDGRNPIVAHEFVGESVEGKDIIVIDDMISSGDSMIDVAKQLKAKGAKRIFINATFGLFTNGMEKFDKAVEEGLIYKVLTTNLVYQKPELLERDYYINVDMSEYTAALISNLNRDMSISELISPEKRIRELVENYNK
jgi:ribose-phosphate pyrophosphokinase